MGEGERRVAEPEGGVTGPALVSQLSEVSVPVTSVAGHAQRSVADEFNRAAVASGVFRTVALRALDLQMLSGEVKAGELMIEPGLFESRFHVAGRTVLAELPPMRILRMAVSAFGERDPLEAMVRVAAPALHLGMFPLERKPGVLGVKSAARLLDLPVVKTVTLGAVRTQRRPVGITVTVRAPRERDACPLSGAMAFRTLEFAVRAAQVERRLFVVKVDLGELPLHSVTAHAVRAQSSLVNVLVAGHAVAVAQQEGSTGTTFDRTCRGMTRLAAFDRFVQAGQRVTRFVMVEMGRIPVEQRGFFSAVLGMTGRTLPGPGPMESAMVTNALCNLLMAGQALGVVDPLAGRVTAIAAVQTFHIAVGLAQGSGRD